MSCELIVIPKCQFATHVHCRSWVSYVVAWNQEVVKKAAGTPWHFSPVRICVARHLFMKHLLWFRLKSYLPYLIWLTSWPQNPCSYLRPTKGSTMCDASIPLQQFHYQESWMPRKKKIVSSIYRLHLIFDNSIHLVSKSSEFNPWLKNRSLLLNKGIVGIWQIIYIEETRHNTAGLGFKPRMHPKGPHFLLSSHSRVPKKRTCYELSLCVLSCSPHSG